MKTLKSGISKVYKVQVDCFKDSQSNSYDKDDTKEKKNSIKSKFLAWYLTNDLECTVQNILMSLNTLFELHMKSKK